MLSKPRCPKAQVIPRKPPLYCEGALCAHQYYCPQTRQYENTPEHVQCKRLPPKEEGPKATPVRYVLNVVPKEPKAPNVGPIAGTQPLEIREDDVIYSGTLQTHTMEQTVTIDDETSSEEIPTPLYTKNVSPIDYGVTKTEEPVDIKPETDTNKEVRKEKANGTVRNTRRRKTKKG